MGKKNNKQANKDGFFMRQIKVYRRYFMFKPSTSKIIGKKIKPSDFKEMIISYKTLEQPKKSFKRAMEVEGIIESDLVKSHKRYGYIQVFLLMFYIIPIYHIMNIINFKLSGGDIPIGLIPSLFPPIVSIMFLTFFYIYFSWVQWRIRNRCLATHMQYLRIILAYPGELSPFNEKGDNMDKKYGKKWNKNYVREKKKNNKKNEKKDEKLNEK